jgi:hypothetical protein
MRSHFPLHAGRYEKLNYIKLTREAEKKVNEVITKKRTTTQDQAHRQKQNDHHYHDTGN